MPINLYRPEQDSPFKKIHSIIGVAAGKGGVGKSTVTVNLALALQRKGYRVGILDADIYGPSMRKMLPESALPTKKGEIYFPADCKGIKMVSMAYFRKEGEATAVRAPIANALIARFITNMNWGELDFLLVDFPPGTGDVQLTLSQKMPLNGAIMVTTPQEVALLDVRKAIHLFEAVKVPILGIVENMSYFEVDGRKNYLFGKGGGERLANEKALPLLGEIPVDPILCTCGDTGSSIFDRGDYAKVPSVQAFLTIAENAVERVKAVQNQELELKKTSLKGSSQLEVEWSDGKKSLYRLSEIQKLCPCAACEGQGKVQQDVGAKGVVSVGRYALRIEFTSGCSSGIYNYSMLREMV